MRHRCVPLTGRMVPSQALPPRRRGRCCFRRPPSSAARHPSSEYRGTLGCWQLGAAHAESCRVLAVAVYRRFDQSSELRATFRAPISLLSVPLHAAASAPASAPPNKIPTPTASDDTCADAKQGASSTAPPRGGRMLSRMSDRRVPLVVVLQQQSTTAAWGSGRNVHDAGMQVVSGDELLASRRAARTTILYDVTAIKFPSMALRGSAATAAVAAQAGSAGGSGDGGGAGAGSGSSRDDAVAGAAMDDGSPPNADAASLLLSPPADGAGDAASAVLDAEAASADDVAAAEDEARNSAISVTVSKRWSVTATACYQIKVRLCTIQPVRLRSSDGVLRWPAGVWLARWARVRGVFDQREECHTDAVSPHVRV